MIKRILLGLDPDDDTRSATQYAIDLAQRFDAGITGLAVVDTEHIESESMGSGIGSMHYAQKFRDRLLDESREIAAGLITAFQEAIETAGVKSSEGLREGVPFKRIIDDMLSHDILVIGREPHFFYNKPERKTSTLSDIVRKCAAPVLVVPKEYKKTKKVLVAYDGHDPSIRALRYFVALEPFGHDIQLELVYVDFDDEEGDAEEMKVHQVAEFLRVHGYETKVSILEKGKPSDLIIAHAQKIEAELIVAGAHSVSSFRAFAFGSTTHALLKKCPIAIFMYR